jgi:hypothetical protein
VRNLLAEMNEGQGGGGLQEGAGDRSGFPGGAGIDEKIGPVMFFGGPLYTPS